MHGHCSTRHRRDCTRRRREQEHRGNGRCDHDERDRGCRRWELRHDETSTINSNESGEDLTERLLLQMERMKERLTILENSLKRSEVDE